MRIVQSFWSKGISSINENAGWYSSKHHWLSWILSVHQLNKFYGQVDLFTDDLGKHILVDQLKLPYSKVNLSLNDLNKYPREYWALAKIKTYQQQSEPFMHVDGDVFIWKNINTYFNKASIFAQNLENTTDYYRRMWGVIAPQLNFITENIKLFHNNRLNYACNMGIVGGYDLNFFKEYCAEAFKFVDKNIQNQKKFSGHNFNIFFEQVLFYEKAFRQKIQIRFLFDQISDDNNYRGMGDFDKIPSKFYLHLIGMYKKNKEVCKMLEIYVMKHYPEEYYNLLYILKDDAIKYYPSKLNEDYIKKKRNHFQENFENNKINPNLDLVGKNIYFEGLPVKFDKLLLKNEDFWLKPALTKTNNKILTIPEIGISDTEYHLDDFDTILIDLLYKKDKVLFSQISAQIKKLCEIDNDQDRKLLEQLFLSRLRKYINLKIIGIIELNRVKVYN